MSSEEKAATVTALTAAVIELALAGVRHRYPDESARAQRLRLADALFGADLAREAFRDRSDAP